jgi:hypothetical protein
VYLLLVMQTGVVMVMPFVAMLTLVTVVETLLQQLLQYLVMQIVVVVVSSPVALSLVMVVGTPPLLTAKVSML